MPPLEESTINTEKLKRLYSGNRAIKALLNNASKRKHNVSTTNVDRLMALLINEENTVVGRQELIKALRELETLGCGRFIIGRRGQPSRFEWGVQITSLGKAVMGAAGAALAGQPSAGSALVVESERIPHAYQLRPGMTVNLDLPVNLTAKEAQRLAEFIRTLPFEDAISSTKNQQE